MRVTCKRWLLAAVVGAALLAVATPASAQVLASPYSRNGVYNPAAAYNMNYPLAYPSPMYPAYPAYNQSNPAMYSAASTNPYTGGAQSTGGTAQLSDPYLNPYYNTNPYATMYSPAGGFLSGAADLVTAQGNYLVQYGRANMLQEEVHRSMLDSRRKVWEEARYERASLMNSEQVRQQDIRNALDRARHDPPLTEIWSGQALNSLFDYLIAQQGKISEGTSVPSVPLSEDVLKHINLTTGKDGNVGLLKSDISWPVALQRPEFEETKTKLNNQLLEAVRQAKFGKVGADLASDIKNNVAKLQDILLQHVSDFKPDEYMTAKKYLNMLDESAKALSDPNVTNYFNDKWTAKGKSVAELIKNMKSKDAAGLRFAPAAPGDEWAYRALYYALRDYDAGLTQLTSAQTPAKQP